MRTSAYSEIEVGFGVQSGHAARASRGNGLSIHVVSHIASGKHACNAGRSGIASLPPLTLR